MNTAAGGRTIASARRDLADAFTQAGIDSADTDARLLIAAALDIDRATLMSMGDRKLTGAENDAIDRLASRRLKREPVARILGRKEFWSLTLQVTPAVLVPRPETETLVELALDLISRAGRTQETLRVLDIGTGSGALLLALLAELPHATGIGTDISEAALAVASDNAARHGMTARCRFVACNIAAGISGRFDLVVSNPPYLAKAELGSTEPEVRDYDPTQALIGGNDGLDCYRAIAAEAGGLLAPGGHLIVELGAGQEAPVRDLFSRAGLKPGEVREDLAGIPRALHATLPS